MVPTYLTSPFPISVASFIILKETSPKYFGVVSRTNGSSLEREKFNLNSVGRF